MEKSLVNIRKSGCLPLLRAQFLNLLVTILHLQIIPWLSQQHSPLDGIVERTEEIKKGRQSCQERITFVHYFHSKVHAILFAGRKLVCQTVVCEQTIEIVGRLTRFQSWLPMTLQLQVCTNATTSNYVISLH